VVHDKLLQRWGLKEKFVATEKARIHAVKEGGLRSKEDGPGVRIRRLSSGAVKLLPKTQVVSAAEEMS
jgi:hypothetical protein